MTVKQSGYGVCVHKQDSVAVFGSLHHIDFLAQQVFVQILRYHQIFPARIIAGIPAGLTDIVGIIGQGQIPDQVRTEPRTGLFPDNLSRRTQRQ